MKMDLGEFVIRFGQDFEEEDVTTFTHETNFKDLDEWDSMLSLSIIGMVYNVFNVKISGRDLHDVDTIGQLYELVLSRK